MQIQKMNYCYGSTVMNRSLSGACSVELGGQRTQTCIHYCMKTGECRLVWAGGGGMSVVSCECGESDGLIGG